MPVFSSSKKKTDEYCCKIFTMDAELQFTIEVRHSHSAKKKKTIVESIASLGDRQRAHDIFSRLSNDGLERALVFRHQISR